MKRHLRSLAGVLVFGWVRFRRLTERDAERWGRWIQDRPVYFQDVAVTRRVALPHGVRMDCGLVDHIERQVWVHGHWDLGIHRVLEAILRPGDTYLDLGANIGYFALLGSTLVGEQGTVVAVEPSTRALRKLTHHLWLNRCRNVLVVSAAAGASWDRAKLTLATEGNIGGSSLQESKSAEQPTESVWVAPMDELLSPLRLAPRLIKLDLEGFELAALRGLERLIEQHRPWIVCEITDGFLRSFGDSAEALIAWMSLRGYKARRVDATAPMAAWTAVESVESTHFEQQFDALFAPPGAAWPEQA
jgi:FkbM family methyltransferase